MNTIEKKEESQEQKMSVWTVPSLEDFANLLGVKLDIDALSAAKKNLTVKTIHGDVELSVFDGMVTMKLYQYFKYGVARRIGIMIQEMTKTKPSTEDIMVVLYEMAQLEVEHGLKPITHTLPVAGSVYVKADGFLFYGKSSGKLRNIEYVEDEKNGTWVTTCTITVKEGNDEFKYDGVATVSGTGARMDDPREKARTKSMRRALRKAFPIGASDEPLGEVEAENIDVDIPIQSASIIKPVSDLSELVKTLEEKPRETKPVDDISKLAEHSKTEEIQEGKPAAEENNKTDDKPKNDMSKVKELYKVLETREDKALLTHDIKFKYGIKSLAMLTEAQAQEILDDLATKV